MPGKRFTEAQRMKLLKLFQLRTGSIQQFAKRHRVSAATLYKWQHLSEADTQSAFVELKPESATGNCCKLVLQTGTVALHFQNLPDTDWLSALIHKMQS